MLALRVIVFGPASGAIAFGYPDGQRVADDSIFLASSDFSLGASRSALRLSRRTRGDACVLRLALYRQVYEPGMSRLGHCFGVVFEFESDVPQGAIALKTIGQLVDLVEGHCCRAGTFCDYRSFIAFLQTEIAPSYDGIREQLESAPVAAGLPPLDGVAQQRFHLEAAIDDGTAHGLIDWFFVDPGSAACEDLIVAPAGSGQPGSAYRSVRSEFDIAREGLRSVYLAALQASTAAAAAQGRERALEDELREQREELLRYRDAYEKVMRTIDESRVMTGAGARPLRSPAPGAQGVVPRGLPAAERESASLTSIRPAPARTSAASWTQASPLARAPDGDDAPHPGAVIHGPRPSFLDTTVGYYTVITLCAVLGTGALGLFVWALMR